MVRYQDTGAMELKEKRKKRFQFLHRLYNLTEGNQSKNVEAYKIGYELGCNRELTQEIFLYLSEEELIQLSVGGRVFITYKGIKEIEEAFSNPDASTEYFPPFNLIYGRDEVKDFSIRHGSPWAVPIVHVDPDKYGEMIEIMESLKVFINELSLEPTQGAELKADVLSVEAQISSPRPKTKVINECVGSIIKILEAAPGTVIGHSLLNQLLQL